MNPWEIRFWSKVQRGEGCWLWTGAIGASGYGNFSIDDATVGAHRVAFRLANGREPVGLLLHSCDNRRCVRPEHLREGTQAENLQDAVARGRVASGDRNGARLHPERLARGEAHPPQARLTDEDVATIRGLVANGHSHRRVARLFGVTFQTISKIVRRERRAS